ncbi:MAG: hypothetical protein ACJ749_19160, partial [Flavisolibacter sp.]
LRKKIAEYFNQHLNKEGSIIIDTVQDKTYKHNHDIHFLTTGLDGQVEHIGSYERERDIWAINKKI